MIFLKHFDTSTQTLYGVGKVHVQRASKVSDLVPIINERMRWTPGTPLKLYEVRLATILPTYERRSMYSITGNQARHDRAHEAEADLHSKRDPGR